MEHHNLALIKFIQENKELRSLVQQELAYNIVLFDNPLLISQSKQQGKVLRTQEQVIDQSLLSSLYQGAYVVNPTLCFNQELFKDKLNSVKLAQNKQVLQSKDYEVCECNKHLAVTALVTTKFNQDTLSSLKTKCSKYSHDILTKSCSDFVCAQPYGDFNLAHHVGDNLIQVKQNRQQLQSCFGFKALCFMNQTHSSKVKFIANIQDSLFEHDCDALVTCDKGLALCVMTADCLPLLLCDTQHQVIAAVHCGWRGIAYNIVENTINMMQKHGAQADCIQAYLGPAIGPNSFEVGIDMMQECVQQQTSAHSVFFPELQNNSIVAQKYLADIYALCSLRLHKCGVHKIYGGIFNTLEQSNLFYSYRRAKVNGRQASVIALN